MTEPSIKPSQTSARAQDARPAEDVHVTDRPLSNGDIAAVSDRESPPGVPRWVKAFGIAAIVLLLAFVGLHFIGLGGGPAMHDMPTHSVMLP